jgi:hypothetical protein
MGYKDHDDEGRSKPSLFIEWFVALFLAFSSCIGGWLMHFGMNPSWMLMLSCVIAIAGAIWFSTQEK